MKVLVLGHNGMLGSDVKSYLEQFYNIETIPYKYPSDEFIKSIDNFNGEWVVNCIGAIPHKYLEFDVNYELPVFLDTLNKFKIIHSSTDNESGDSPYSESKRIASKWLLENSKNTYSIKSSIIGNGNSGLLQWVLSNNTLNGYRNCMWNGITTLEWAKFCKFIIDGQLNETLISLRTDCISKYELLCIICEVYNHNAKITEDFTYTSNNCIDGTYVGNIKNKLIELKKFNENLFFNNNILQH